MTTTNKRITLTAAVLVLAALPAFAQQSSQIRETTAEEPQPVAAAEGQALTEQQTGASKFADRIAAVVNNDVITEYELQNRVRQAAINLRQQNINLPPMQELRRQVLERMITEKATEQRAKELGIRVDEQMVSASIEQIARNNKMTVDELRERLRADDVSFGAFRAQVRDEITAQRLREREVDSKITIPESEVDAFLAEQTGFTTNDTQEYHVRHILLPIPPALPTLKRAMLNVKQKLWLNASATERTSVRWLQPTPRPKTRCRVVIWDGAMPLVCRPFSGRPLKTTARSATSSRRCALRVPFTSFSSKTVATASRPSSPARPSSRPTCATS